MDPLLQFPDPAGASPSGRARRAQIALETLAACDAGHYIARAGDRVEIAAAIADARGRTRLVALGDVAAAPPRASTGEVVVTEQTTLEALRALDAERRARSAAGRAPLGGLGCLNFASARNPGGGFLGGAQAQEETLARSSGLYPCLLAQPGFYQQNRAHRPALYLDLALVSPQVPFFRDDAGGWLDAPVVASVVTCPAPNAGALRQQGRFDVEAVAAAFRRRTAFVLDLAIAEGIGWLVLGAWGAGAFGNDPWVVARAFAEALPDRGGWFERLVFAIPAGPNHAPFATTFRARGEPGRLHPRRFAAPHHERASRSQGPPDAASGT